MAINASHAGRGFWKGVGKHTTLPPLGTRGSPDALYYRPGAGVPLLEEEGKITLIHIVGRKNVLEALKFLTPPGAESLDSP